MTDERPVHLTRDEVLLMLDNVIASAASARAMIAKLWPQDVILFSSSDPGACQHENRAPSMPSFCLDCETDLDDPGVGVSAP